MKKKRLLAVDAARGVAIAGVVLFHLVWDLEFTGFISGLAFHPLWLAFGRSLAGSFMFLAGVSLVLAHGAQFRARIFFRRLAVIVAAALAITIVTFLAFPSAFVYFGILHSIAVASLIGIAFLRLPASASLLAGSAMMALPWFISLPAFDPRWLAWVGFSANPSLSNDFVPVVPWAGATLLGIAFAKVLDIGNNRLTSAGLDTPFLVRLGWLGRHSLAIYLLHQPVMLAIIVPLSRLF
ncbi:heparan-alpha-glucosaminide N-acetyltransferase [Hoeflea sp. AS60]|uniref:heparan-alpha-glucosaminide N-acetyltransferase n=1 Tax=Hoeflea sp. AS60 TaxID=3135780 RepID=UPI00316B1DA3